MTSTTDTAIIGAGPYGLSISAHLSHLGVPHQVLGEDVGAFVVCKPGVAVDEPALLAFCADRLADYKRPRRLWLVSELPRNATGKVMKHKLREQLAP